MVRMLASGLSGSDGADDDDDAAALLHLSPHTQEDIVPFEHLESGTSFLSKSIRIATLSDIAYMHSLMELPGWQLPHWPTQTGGSLQRRPIHSPVHLHAGRPAPSIVHTPSCSQ